MIQPLPLTPDGKAGKGMQRVTRIPLFIVLAIVLISVGLLFAGLSSRGMLFGRDDHDDGTSTMPATSYADKLKQGVSNAIIGDEQENPIAAPPAQPRKQTPPKTVPTRQLEKREQTIPIPDDWRARLKREEEEQISREKSRIRLSRLQAENTAMDSPLKIDMSSIATATSEGKQSNAPAQDSRSDLTPLMASAIAQRGDDQNGQTEKQAFLEGNSSRSGYLQHDVVPAQSQFELKRGSVIPATLITGINSDLPGRVIAQVSQNVYDSSTGSKLLIPQGAKLLGRYDSKVSFGQSRVLVAWTDLVFPNGKTLQIDAMAGVDAAGYGGFADRVDNHYLRTFGTAALVALIGTGIDLAMPSTASVTGVESPSDTARRNFADSFGKVAVETVSKGLNNQPTIEIRPGYQFNVLVDKDINLRAAYLRQ